MDQAAIVIKKITVTYGAFKALDEVSLAIFPGQIVGLVGHNGAGKSTLINTLTGAIKPVSGEIEIDGKTINYSHRWDPLHTSKLGLHVIHQEPSLVGALSVADNITFKTENESANLKIRETIAIEALARVGSTISPKVLVSSLNFGDRQIVDLARSLSDSIKVLLLDEPTAALSGEETHRLHELLLNLAQQGKSIVYVSHRLRDILEICDRIIVLREGHIVMDQPSADVTPKSLSEAVCPALIQSSELCATKENSRGKSLIKASWKNQKFEFASGEIIGLFGMAAGPQFSFVQYLFGLGAYPSQISINGKLYSIIDPSHALKYGIAYVSSDREKESLFPLMSAQSNTCMPWLNKFSTFGFLSKRLMHEAYSNVRNTLKISGPSGYAPITEFSGGNKQKHVLGRWLMDISGLKLLLLCQPYQGVDIQARQDIAKVLRVACSNGLTILIASSEVDEITNLADRAYVCQGELWKELPKSAVWESDLLEALIEGIKRKEA